MQMDMPQVFRKSTGCSSETLFEELEDCVESRHGCKRSWMTRTNEKIVEEANSVAEDCYEEDRNDTEEVSEGACRRLYGKCGRKCRRLKKLLKGPTAE